MGAPLTRSTGSAADLRRSWAVFGALLVAALAGVLHFLGADSAEVVGTLLFAVVFGVTLLGGRVAGLVAAGVATGVYAWLRRDAVDEAGAAQLGVVVIGRAVSYFVLAYVTHVVRDRLPRLPVVVLSVPDSPGPVVEEVPGLEAPAAHGVPPGAYAMADDAYQEPAYEGYGREPEESWMAAAPVAAPDLGVAAVPDLMGRTGGNGVDMSTALYEDYRGPEEAVPPQLPAGWAHPQDEYGDEIPVGHTGELFLQDLAGPPDEVPMSPGQMPPEQQPYYSSQGYDAPRGYGDYQDDSDYYQGYDDQQGYNDQQAYDGYQQYDDRGGYGQAAQGYGDRRDELDYQGYGDQGYGDQGYGDQGYDDYQAGSPWDAHPEEPPLVAAPQAEVPYIDPDTKLWTAGYFRDRIFDEREQARLTGAGFSVVMIQIPDTPFQTLSQRREVALLRELGHQFVRAQVVDHLVHLPDEGHHWFAVVLSDTDKTAAHAIERRLRSAIAGYLRNRGLGLGDVQSAALTSPDDDEMMATIWTSLLGESMEDQAAW